MNFSKPIKIYLFKDKGTIDISFSVNDNYAIGYALNVAEFERWMSLWDQNPNSGIDIHYDHAHWFIQHKKTGARKENAPTSYVRISISRNGIKNHFRVSYDDVVSIQREYFYQKHNKMFWDE